MKKYEAMFIIRPDLSEEARNILLGQLQEVVRKNNGEVNRGDIWAERKKLYFPLKKYREGAYYLLDFTAPTDSIAKIRSIYKINEDILRVLITVKE